MRQERNYKNIYLFCILYFGKQSTRMIYGNVRLHIRRSDKVSHPSSSYSFMRLQPCHVPVKARAAWYRILSTFSMDIFKDKPWGG